MPAERTGSCSLGPFSQALVVVVMEFVALQHSYLLIQLIFHKTNLTLMISLDRLTERLAAESPLHSQHPVLVLTVLDGLLGCIDRQSQGGKCSEHIDLNVLIRSSNNHYQH